MKSRWVCALVMSVFTAACGTESPAPQDAGGDVVADASDGAVTVDASDGAVTVDASDGAVAVCVALATDYQPRAATPSHATWPACRSDNNRFQPFTPDQITSVRRANDFELINANPEPVRDAMGATVAPAHPMPLFDATRDPTAAEFTAAAAYYASAGAMSGLVERFSRRPDEHFTQPAGAVTNAATGEYDDHWCGTAANWMTARDYCVGPAYLQPIMTGALAAGSMGAAGAPSRVHAARIEAALLYLLYASVYKESLSCLQDVADCDSSWGYYTVGVERDATAQKSLARYVRALDPEVHNRVWDALLAVHCWRELDGGLQSMPPVAANRVMRERARDQLDRALNRAMVLVLNARLRALATALDGSNAAAPAHQAFVGVVGPLFARALETWVPMKYATTVARVGGASVAATVATLRRSDITAAGARSAADALGAIFDCP